jgi:hypothetical protein
MVNTGVTGINKACMVVSQLMSTVIVLFELATSVPLQRIKRYPGDGTASSLTSVTAGNE